MGCSSTHYLSTLAFIVIMFYINTCRPHQLDMSTKRFTMALLFSLSERSSRMRLWVSDCSLIITQHVLNIHRSGLQSSLVGAM